MKLSLFFLILGMACSHVPKPAPVVTETVAPAPVKKVRTPRTIPAKVVPGKFKIDDMIKKTLGDDWEKSYAFTEIDREHGYAVMEYFSDSLLNYYGHEGYIEYFLYKGATSDLLVRVVWGCSEKDRCAQSIEPTQFIGSKFQMVPFTNYLSKAAHKKWDESLGNCTDFRVGLGGLWTYKTCLLALKFSTKNQSSLSLYDSLWALDGQYSGKKIQALNWNARKLVFE